jgi:glucose/arabinose dehydrogenase
MRHKWLPIAFLFAVLALSLAACGPGESATATPGPVVVASPRPTNTATLVASPAAVAPTLTPTTVPPSPTPSAISPNATPLPSASVPAPSPEASATPTALPPTAPPLTATAADPATNLAAIRLELQPVISGLEMPVGIAHAGDGSGRLFVLEKVGRIRVVRDGALLPAPFLDISDRVGSSGSEQGLLGLAFHPGYAQNGLFFVNYTDRAGDTVVSRFSLGADPARADPASEVVLLALEQPAANHNGGHLAFGPDGYVYIGTGDGGASGDRFGNGQNGATLLGAMLRLDVDGGEPYAVPPGNPFLDDPGVRDEIWAIGLRNPWRYSFDRLTGELYIADVGQNQYEEVNVQPAGSPGGENYGWPIMEASHCFPESQTCSQEGLILPVVEYDHGQGCSVTGGYVYRGETFPSLRGIYLFGDYCSGRIWGLARSAGGTWQAAELAQTDLRISSFGEDEAGELYVLDMGNGVLYRIGASAR